MKGCTQKCPLFRTKTVKEPEEFIYLVSAMEKQCICPKTTARSNLETSMSWIKKDSLKYGNILKNYEDPKSDDVSDGEDSYISFCHCQWSQGGKSQRRKSKERSEVWWSERKASHTVGCEALVGKKTLGIVQMISKRKFCHTHHGESCM